MADDSTGSITHVLREVKAGDSNALERLWKRVRDELHAMARNRLKNIPPGQTLQPTVLVDDVFVRLVGGGQRDWENRRHFFAAAARAMRQICCDVVRARMTVKRGGNRQPAPMEELVLALAYVKDPVDHLAIDEALTELEREDSRLAEVVQLKFYLRMQIHEIAEALGVSRRTVNNDWKLAKAWLHRRLKGGDTRTADTLTCGG